MCNRPAEPVGVHEVRESALAVDLDDRDPLPVCGLELGVAVDQDLAVREAELGLQALHHAPGRFAEVAARGVVEDDFGATDRCPG